jgi:hypothetical protein
VKEGRPCLIHCGMHCYVHWGIIKDFCVYPTARGRQRKNHIMDELKWPVCLSVCIGAKVMLLCNYVVEEDLKNGSVSTVVDIVYDTLGGPSDPESKLLYIVVKFPNSKVSVDDAWDCDHPTHIPVLVATLFCNKVPGAQFTMDIPYRGPW